MQYQATNNYVKDLQFRRLRERSTTDREFRVLRGGVDDKIPQKEIVVGDVVPLFVGTPFCFLNRSTIPGDQIPADGLFLSGQGLGCDESSMTGEPDVRHKVRSCFIPISW